MGVHVIGRALWLSHLDCGTGGRAAIGVLAGVAILAAALDHPSRTKIYRHLLLLPGDHFRSIARVLRLGVGTARHHLEVLAREGLVFADRSESRTRYYPMGNGQQPQRNRLYREHWAYRDVRQKVYLAVRRLGDARPSTVARSLGISRQLAAYHLARLRREGRVRGTRGRYRAP